jgi:hypothetical protein
MRTGTDREAAAPAVVDADRQRPELVFAARMRHRRPGRSVFARIPKGKLFGRLGLVAPLRLARLGDPVERPSIRHVVVPAPARKQLPGDEGVECIA